MLVGSRARHEMLQSCTRLKGGEEGCLVSLVVRSYDLLYATTYVCICMRGIVKDGLAVVSS
jgi:hypothetical protein